MYNTLDVYIDNVFTASFPTHNLGNGPKDASLSAIQFINTNVKGATFEQLLDVYDTGFSYVGEDNTVVELVWGSTS